MKHTPNKHHKDVILSDFSSSLVNVPHTVLEHFGLEHSRPALTHALSCIKGASKVITFMVDGLGYELWERHAADTKLFKTISAKRLYERITTIFPSSTAPALTTIHTGLTPKEHAVLEWYVYLNELDSIVAPLPSASYGPDGASKQIVQLDEDLLVSAPSLYEMMGKSNISSFYFVPNDIKSSSFTKATAKGATIVGYTDENDLVLQIAELVNEREEEKMYIYVYWGAIDVAEHTWGPNSKQATSEVLRFSDMIEKRLLTSIEDSNQSNTALLVTADHGQISVNDGAVIHLNDYPQLLDLFKMNAQGKRILPTGNARDVFVFVDDARVDDAVILLEELIGNYAQIHKTDTAFINKFFGDAAPHPEFKARLGSIVIMPFDGIRIWYSYPAAAKKTLRGDHGGLTEEEMYIPLIAAKISDISN